MIRRREVDHVKYEHRRQLAYVSLPSQQRTGRARWNMNAPGRRGEYYISVGETTKPYGRSSHNAAYLSHIVLGVLILWKNGQVVLTQARWRCGGRSWKFRLIDEPNSEICPACKIERLGPRPGK